MFGRLTAIAAAAFAVLVLTPGSAAAFLGSGYWFSCGTNCNFARHQAFVETLVDAQLANAAIFFAVSFVLGLMVIHRGMRAGYARKILALTLYVAPFYLGYWWAIPFSLLALTVSAATFMLCIALMSQPLRSRFPPLAIAFAAIDRPEDRPLTILWLLTAVAATWAVLMVWAVEPLDVLLAWYRQALGDQVIYIYIRPGIGLSHIMLALFISGVGDALAEPVGLAFGRHKYRVRALWTDRVYTRSLEGSACVLLSGIVGVLFVQWIGPGFGGDTRFVLTLILVPVVATLAEAVSPHTWDQPLIIASCGLTAAFIDGGA